MTRCLPLAIIALSCFAAFPAPMSTAQEPTPRDLLRHEFENPPETARPRTWWHWTRSNVNKEGITKDLEWMKRVGIAGFQLADVNFGRGQEVDPKTPFGTDEWYNAVRHAAAEAHRLDLEMAIFSSPGWSETGGPWVSPKQAMKKLVWSETHLVGPSHFSGTLEHPPTTTGQIRNVGSDDPSTPRYYADSAVIAFPTPATEDPATPARPQLSTPLGPLDGSALLDDDLNTLQTIATPENASTTWIQFDYEKPFTARAFTIGGRGSSGRGIPVGRVVAVKDDGSEHPLVTLPGSQLYRQGMVRTFAFEPVTAKRFRIDLVAAPLGPAETMSQSPSSPLAEYVLSETMFHSSAKIQRWEEKAGFSFLFDYEAESTPKVHPDLAISPDAVIDLTSQLRPDGTLDWNVPDGNWTILRMGYSLTGAMNRPATPAGSGLEADKLNRKHMEAYVRGYFGPLKEALGPLFGTSLRYVMMDSWEAGTNNWTDDLIEHFRSRRGYDPSPYLATLSGSIVGNADVSDRFLWDFRRTLADLWADNHYGTMADQLEKWGIGIYAEASGVSLEMPEDTLLNKSKVEIPMGEFWVNDLHPRLMYLQDVRGAASAAHAYGKRIVAAEAFTGGGWESPARLKNVADYWFAQGVNRIVFHTSAHQPLDSKPGNTMVGTHLHRNITWAEDAKPFIDYLARCSHLLQQGHFVADIAYLLDEGAPSTPPIWGAGTQPTPPDGFDYDFINADVLLNRMTVDASGRLALPDGMSYRVLVLPNSRSMRPELLRKIETLVQGGAIVVGPKPLHSPSLQGYPTSDETVKKLTAKIWGDLDGVSRTIRHLGKGKVYWGWPLDRVMNKENILKDFECSLPLDSDLVWMHRQSEDVDFYWIANLANAPVSINARFRTFGKEAELWYPDSGDIQPASFKIDGQQTIVPLDLEKQESVFVVFGKRTDKAERQTVPTRLEPLTTLDGSWQLSFPEGFAAPESIALESLAPWTDHETEGIKHFSGTAAYSKTINIPRSWLESGRRLLLDLGEVGDIAKVSVNGQDLGVLWKPPYRIDISDTLKTGQNQLHIEVTNQWTNRLLGDSLLSESEKVLNSPASIWGFGENRGVESPQPPRSGLIGPVTLFGETQ